MVAFKITLTGVKYRDGKRHFCKNCRLIQLTSRKTKHCEIVSTRDLD